VGRAGFEPTKA